MDRKIYFFRVALICTLANMLISTTLFSQSPEKLSYQAVVRNTNNQLVVSQQVGMRITILQGSVTGATVYTETLTPTTNTNGLVTVEIGSGAGFSTINWANGIYYIKTETDPTGGSTYTITGVSQLLSVPYALHSKTAETLTDAVIETDPVFVSWDKTTGITITESQVIDLQNYLTAETDPAFNASTAAGITQVDTASWNAKLGSFSETDPEFTGSEAFNVTAIDITNLANLSGINTGDQSLGLIGNDLSITNGNTITLPGSNSKVPIYTSIEIEALTPENGQALYNETEDLYQIYNGSEWKSFSANCWPQPTIANAGSDQRYTDGTITTTLEANPPLAVHGTGLWTIVSGTGGSFADATLPSTTFTGTECTAYNLQWTITTNCNSSLSNVNIVFSLTPTTANAGTDQTFTDGTISATLEANTPVAGYGTGLWTIVSGTGGSFADATSPTSTFAGDLHEAYTLRWTITTNCSSSADDVVIGFYQDIAGSLLTDTDGNAYNTVWIGSQLWIAENLRTTKYRDGSTIPNVTDNGAWVGLSTPAYCWYNNDIANKPTYGALYNWYTVETGNLCPTGWHVPTVDEWTTLTTYVGGESVAGTKLKATSGWAANGNGTDNYGFSALPGGYRLDGNFRWVGADGYWWSSTQYDATVARSWYMNSDNGSVLHDGGLKRFGFSVRCVRDN